MQSIAIPSPACSACRSVNPARQALRGPIFRRSTFSDFRQDAQSPRRKTVRYHNHRRITTMGLPIPIIGPLFNPVVALIAYAFGAARFGSNFNKTTYDSTQKTKLTLLWPVLLIGSKSFREEFKKATRD